MNHVKILDMTKNETKTYKLLYPPVSNKYLSSSINTPR